MFGIKLILPENKLPLDVTEFRETLKQENQEEYLPKPQSRADLTPVIQTFTNEVQAYFKR